MEYEYRRFIQMNKPRSGGNGAQAAWRGRGNINNWPNRNQTPVHLMDRLVEGDPYQDNGQAEDSHDTFSPYEAPYFLMENPAEDEFVNSGFNNGMPIGASLIGGGFGNTQLMEPGGGFGRGNISDTVEPGNKGGRA